MIYFLVRPVAAATSSFWVVAQTGSGGDSGGWGDIIATYGPFAPFAAFLIWLVQLLWKDNKEKDKIILSKDAEKQAILEKVLPLVTESQTALNESAEALRVANKNAISSEQVDRLIRTLEFAEAKLPPRKAR